MTSEASGSDSDADHDHGTEFWADEAARTVVEADRPRVVKGGVSPSGVPHIGNFNEVLRGGYVALALERMGEDPRQVFTRDDRDPLRRVPEKLATVDGEIV
ncbi:MAG: lysine--tRNA ligase, partial [Halobacteria archaeon]|nr:lysine--tRNA ligase [Halobacteria archaeon]